jgi:thioredoxin 1
MAENRGLCVLMVDPLSVDGALWIANVSGSFRLQTCDDFARGRMTEGCKVHGFGARLTETPHGMFVVHARVDLDAKAQHDLHAAMFSAGLAAPHEGHSDDEPGPAQLVAGQWLPPVSDGSHRRAFDAIALRFDLDEAWFFQCGEELPRAKEPFGFELERYPEILQELDWEEFGIALKLGGTAVSGEERVLETFVAFWISRYAADDDDPDEEIYRHTGSVFDPHHRSALLWVDRFTPPFDNDAVAHHALWIVQRIAEVLPVRTARFSPAGSAVQRPDGSYLVLAGNPFAKRFEEDGELAALAWAENQRDWSRVEIAAMLVEIGKRHDPDDADDAAVALRLFDRAAALDAANDEAPFCSLVALIRQKKIGDALARARKNHALRLPTAGLVAEHAPESLASALELADTALFEEAAPEAAGDLLAAALQHAKASVPALLAAIPKKEAFVPYVYNASFKADHPERLPLLDWVIAQPPPQDRNSPAWQGWLASWNNACISAHAVGDFARAVEIANRAQPWTDDNPYILHSAACAYAAAGDLDRAFGQVEKAIRLDYDHLDKLEKDTDLGAIVEWPQFKKLFEDRRTRLEASEGVVDVDDHSFEGEVLRHEKPVLVDFSATWCGPCRALSPVVEKLAREAAGAFRVVKLDIDESPETAERFDVKSVPTLMVFSGGEARATHVGLCDKRTLLQLVRSARGS